MVVPRRHEDDRLAVRGLEHVHDVRRDQRPPRERSEHRRLEERERRVVPFDLHDGLVRLDAVAVVERAHLELVELVGAELEDRDRLVHAAEPRVLLLEDLHDDARAPLVAQQRVARVVEVRVGVPAGAHLLDRQVEDLGLEPSSGRLRHVRARGRRRVLPRRPRAAPASARPWRSGAAARAPASRAPARRGCRGLRVIQPKISVDAATAPICAAARAWLRMRSRRKAGEHVADGRRRDERPDQMAAAALVLLLRAVAVLVAADRDVLGAVVRGELAAAQRERGGRERQEAREQLLRSGPQAPRLANAAHGDRRADHRRATRRLCIGSCASGSARFTCGRSANASARRAGPRRNGLVHVRGAKALARRRNLDRAVLGRGSRTPTSWARARARRSGAPCRRAGSSRRRSSLRRVASSSPQGALQRCAAAGRPSPIARVVDGDDRHHLADRGREKDLVGGEQPRRAGKSLPRPRSRPQARAAAAPRA